VSEARVLVFTVEPAEAGKRLDVFLRERFPDYSRSRLQQWIKAGHVEVEGRPAKASTVLRGGEKVEVRPQEPPPLKAFPEPLPLKVIYEDADVIVVEKPAGMVVHAGAGMRAGTLVNALLYRFGQLPGADQLRPGIVHRLDRYTSGLLLVARRDRAHEKLRQQFTSRLIEKYYLALVHGEFEEDSGKIEKPIARDPRRRTRMTARLPQGRPALTYYWVRERLRGFTLLEVRIITGRTHQIRAHLASIGHPVVGDPVYGAPRQIPGMPPLGRYFLHAWKLGFRQPTTGEWITVESPLPPELDHWLTQLRTLAGRQPPGV